MDSIVRSILSEYGYSLLSKIGSGTYATVYKALDNKNKKEVAIKRVEDPIKNQADRDNLMVEVDNHDLVKHLDFVPKLYTYFEASDYDYKIKRTRNDYNEDEDDDEDEKHLYIIMEHINSPTCLDQIMENASWDFVWMLLYHVLQVMDKLNDEGYCHHDIHWGNMIWTGEHVILLDFDTLEPSDRTPCTDVFKVLDGNQVEDIADKNDWDNEGHGLEKIRALYQFADSLVGNGDDYSAHLQDIMDEYDDIDDSII